MKLDRFLGRITLALAALFVLGVGVLNAQHIERVFEGYGEDKAQQLIGPQDRPVITEEQAQTTALAANPGATIVKAMVEKENGLLQYTVILNDRTEVLVNAASGQIINANETERDQDDEDDGD